jgi:hypothetical protein
MRTLSLRLIVFSAAFFAAGAAHAQVTTSFSELKTQLQIGERVYVTDTRGLTLKGNLAGLTSTGLEIRTERGLSTPPLRMMEADVNNIVVERFDRIWNGALIGFLIGAGAGTLIELGGRTEYQKFSGSGTISMGALTLVTGLVIDVFNREKTTVYVHTPTRP